MLLAIDIGSTNITLGLLSSGALVHTFRLQSRREQTSDEYALALAQLFELEGVARQIGAAVIASVVPSLTAPLASAVRRAFGREALIVDGDTDIGLRITVDRPGQVGVDRLVNAAALRHWLLEASGLAPGEGADTGVGAIGVDLGTATTLDCLSPRGEFVGGVIVPGLRVGLDALLARTARLPAVPLVAPARTLGKNTIECLQSGVVFGYAALIDGLVGRLKAELGFECRVVATGGLADVVAQHATSIERVDPDLTLRGLWLIYERNARRALP
jgi:type III pantothenate kinase